MISILVANAKGGCGKTTIATNLAAAYASRGFQTWLVDADRQQSARQWCALRGKDQPLITCHKWRDDLKFPKRPGYRMIVDAPAGVRTRAFAELLEKCDLAIVPVMPSGFDIAASERLLDRVDKLKPVRKGSKPVAVVVNRFRKSTRAGTLLLKRLEETGRTPAAIISDRAAYPDCASAGEGIFEKPGRSYLPLVREWEPLIRFIESFA
ncbi:MAG: ParA family protein [Rhodospirillales bacterium]